MSQWIGLGILAASSLWGFAVIWGRFSERMDFMKGEIIQLQQLVQTPGEREALAEVLETKFKAHEREDDIRFDNLTHSIDAKLESLNIAVVRILNAISNNGKKGSSA